MIYIWFTGINHYKLAVAKDRDSIFTTITTIWKPGFSMLSDKEISHSQTMSLRKFREYSDFAI
jgi:hypothetical protein